MRWSAFIIIGLLIQVSSAQFSSFVDKLKEVNPVNVLFQNKCIEALGCFYTGPPFFDPINRPFSLSPSDNMMTKFLLFTPANPTQEELLEPTAESIQNSSFNPGLPIKVLIHGYRTDLDVDNIKYKMKDALLKAGDFNIIVVDWTENNGFPYKQAVANTRVVGAQVAQLLKTIMENTDVQPENIHIIGHSLGGHVAGYAGERIPNLGRITGLDPAGPFFQLDESSVRLDYTDALFVDVIHTDGGENFVHGLGVRDAVGHMDFYPNGGKGQPGCTYIPNTDSAVGGIANVTVRWLSNTCDHTRASEYFLESIDNSACRFLATWCNSYDDFEKGDCSPKISTLSEMGFHAKKIEGVPAKSKFYLRTNSSSPYCIEESVHI